MQVEEVKISDIENHPNNPKVHNDNQIRLIEKSIKKFGYTNPVILSSDGVILAGHARVKAAIQMGQDTIPCIRTKLTGKDADAYLIADNRLTELAQYDRDILSDLLSDLPKDLVDLTGFDTVQVDALLSGEDIPDIEKFISDSQPEEPREEVDAEPQIDRAAELNIKWQVQTGDIWQCGDHRIICGDCTDPNTVEMLLGGGKVDLLLTDPPYGVSIVSGKSKGTVGGGGKLGFGKVGGGKIVDSKEYPVIVGDESTDSARKAISLLDSIKNKIIFGGNYFTDFLPPSRCWIIWDKENPGNCFADAELAWTSFDKNVKLYHWLWNGLSRKGERAEELKSRVHPTQKPVGLFKLILQDYSETDEVVIDPFLGSGTTLIACENTGRKCRGIEISPEYCAVVLERFKDATGKEPVRING